LRRRKLPAAHRVYTRWAFLFLSGQERPRDDCREASIWHPCLACSGLAAQTDGRAVSFCEAAPCSRVATRAHKVAGTRANRQPPPEMLPAATSICDETGAEWMGNVRTGIG
jgi:hypothetical protein